jgi:hypothetical protein
MEFLIRLMRVLWYVDSSCAVLVLLRLGSLGIHRRYPALMLFLAMDVVGGIASLHYGTRSLAYYWIYLVSNSLIGSALLIWMCREMFAELYYYHPGLRGLTPYTLRRSILIGSSAALALAPPVGILHWGDSQYQCWQFPLFEMHRCLSFGVAVFVVTMWRKLRSLPLTVPGNAKTYAFSTCLYLSCSGMMETVILVEHARLATRVLSAIMLAANLAFYGSLIVLLKRPAQIRQAEHVPVDPQEVAWLSSISWLFVRVDEAQRRGRASALRRFPLLALFHSFRGVWKACARAGGIIAGSAEKE